MPPTTSSNPAVCFGVFEVDLRSGELRKKGIRVKIQELPFRALKLLLSRPNEVLSRDDFRHALWPDDVFVDFDRGITSTINRLREALGDSAENPVFIETVGRRGYRWIAPTHVPATVPDSHSALVPPSAQHAPVREPNRNTAYRVATVLLLLLAIVLAWPRIRSAQSVGAGSTAAPVSSRALSSQALSSQASSSQASSSPGFTHLPANREAEELYLQGRFFWNKRTPESLTRAVDFFTQAIVHDPGYAQAYVGLADCYNLLREFSVMPATEAYPRALAAAKRAVELDDRSSQAHASLAFVSAYGMWDTATAEREFRRAIELDANNSVAHHWYATYLTTQRRFPEALAEIERAQALDPTSNSVVADKGTILFDAGRREEATALLRQVEETDPNFMSPHRELKYVYLLTADYPNYLTESRKEAVLMHDTSALAVADAASHAFSAGGSRAMLQAVLKEQKKLYDHGSFSPYFLAETCAIVGSKREALRYLQAAYDQRADGLLQMEGNEAFDNLHSEPQFRGLIAKVGLPPLS